MPRIRNSLGKFTMTNQKIQDTKEEKAKAEDDGFLYKEIKFRMPILSIMNILKFILIVFLASPWVYIWAKRGSFTRISEKITEYYDEKFTVPNGTCSSPEKPLKNNNL